MHQLQMTRAKTREIRFAGLLYLVIIVAGLSTELLLRGPLIDFEDAGATAAAILSAPSHHRLAIAADLIMVICDAGLAILLFLIFRSMALGLALAAMVFRLIQTVLITVSLMSLLTGWLLVSRTDMLVDAPKLALVFFELHAHGYDLGLVSSASTA